jgi:putative transposase
MPTFQRKNIRLSPNNYLGKRDYFVTLCCDHRRPYLSDPTTVLPILDILKSESIRHSFDIHAYCAMPNHLHFLASGTADYSDLLMFVNSFKKHTEFDFHRRTKNQLWQSKFYDHILRRASALHDVAAYIWMNPVRKSLCTDPTAYPYSGSLTNAFPRQSTSAYIPPWKTTKGS